MTVTETEAGSFVATGHPLRHFLVALGLLAAGCLALWWAGLAAPRLSAGPREGRFDIATRRATLALALHNDGLLPFELGGLAADYDGIQVDRVRVDGHDVSTGPTQVPGGGTALVEADLTVDCDRLRADTFAPDLLRYTDELLRFSLRMPAGTERSANRRVVGTINPLLSRACLPGG